MRRFEASGLGEGEYREIARVLKADGLVCMPTDTVYGLAVDPTRPAAIEKLFRAKGRSRSEAVILLVDSVAMAEELGFPPPDLFAPLAGAFWPGPMTFILPARGRGESGGGYGATVALRWPEAEVAAGIVGAMGGPITSTSANRSGEPVSTSADAAARSIGDIDVLIDAGEIGERPPSSLLDLTVSPPRLVREGAVSAARVARVLARRLAEAGA
jgi:L-threonylcarbamoyladenylate synthase